MKFGIRLMLNEANLKIADAGIPENADSLTMGLPIPRDRSVARVGQTHKKWNKDSASIEQTPQIGL
jgi:hypothetical protein